MNAMPNELIRGTTRRVLREHLVAHSVLREIRDVFDSAGVDWNGEYEPGVSGQRRTLVEQYYETLDFASPRDVEKFLEVYESVVFTAENEAQDPFQSESMTEALESEIEKLKRTLRRDGYAYEDGRIQRGTTVTGLDSTGRHAVTFDAAYLRRHVQRIENSVDTDPAQAIGQAKELLETCCKTILRERGEPVKGNPSLHELVRETRNKLSLMPHEIPEDAAARKTILRLLSNLAEITRSMAELRNSYGTGHGKDGKWRGLSPRHARLAVGAAVTLTNFLFDTHLERQK
jgi:hypothetical protein